MTDFQDQFKLATTGKKPARPGRKKQLNLVSTPDKDAAYVETRGSKKNDGSDECVKNGQITIGYDFSSEYKDLTIEENNIKLYVKKEGGFCGLFFEKKLVSKFWYNTVANLFGFSYAGSVNSFTHDDPNTLEWGLCLKPKSKFKPQHFETIFKDYEVSAEKATTTDIGCNIPGETSSFHPLSFMKKAKQEQRLLSPKKNKKVIENDSECELSQDDEDKVTTKSNTYTPEPLKEEKRKIEEKDSDTSPEKPPLKKVKKVVEQKKQELSSSESEDVSDTEIVTKHHVTRSKTKSTRVNLDLDKVVLTKYSIQITLRDISRLEPDEFLNDNIIDFYLRYLEEQFHGPKAKHVKNDFYIFNTHFYQLLKKDSSRAAERIAKNVALFEKKLIFIPVNENVHWSLIVICNPNGTSVKKEKIDVSKRYPADARMLMYCDSLGGAIPTNTTKRVREFLAKRYSFENPNEKPLTFTADNFPVGKANLPKQDNHVDCGVFMIHYIQLLVSANIENLPLDKPELFQTSDIPTKRSSIKREIEYEISLNPQPTQIDQSFNSQSDSVMAISQLEDSVMKEAAIEEEPSTESPKESKESEHNNNETTATQESEDLFTEKVLEHDNEN